MKIEDLTIVVCCNKKDFFLAKICIVSIRFYYPDIAIELVKDPGNGKFNSNQLERSFNVKAVDLGIKKMGWSGAKFHYLYKNQDQKGKKILILDADIVFTGPFLDKLLPDIGANDYLVSIEKESDPYAEWVKNTYFDINAIYAAYPKYKYPGYFFNAGQIFLTLGAISITELNKFFNPSTYPFWLNTELFPLVDQSVYNYLLPTLSKEKLKLGTSKFLIWGKSQECEKIALNSIKDGSLQIGVIHWAGCFRDPHINKMLRSDILNFFEAGYYKKIAHGNLRYHFHAKRSCIIYNIRSIFNGGKKILKKVIKKCSLKILLVRKSFVKNLLLLGGFTQRSGHWIYEKMLTEDSNIIDLGANQGMFSKEVFERYGAKCYAIEPNTNLLDKVAELDIVKLNFVITKENGPVNFYNSENHEASSVLKNFASSLGQTTTNMVEGINWSSLMKLLKIKNKKVHILKVDIEGSELDLIESFTSSELADIIQITVEFHDWLDKSLHERTLIAIKKLIEAGFMTFTDTPNHTWPLEILFLNKKYIKFSFVQKQIIALYKKATFLKYA